MNFKNKHSASRAAWFLEFRTVYKGLLPYMFFMELQGLTEVMHGKHLE